MCKFYVGQEVVYIGNDLRFDPNPGKTVHVVKAIRENCCKPYPQIYTGVDSLGTSYCESCGWRKLEVECWKSSQVFRPLIDQYTEEEIEAVNIDEILEHQHDYTNG
jgi:hypothetical protein